MSIPEPLSAAALLACVWWSDHWLPTREKFQTPPLHCLSQEVFERSRLASSRGSGCRPSLARWRWPARKWGWEDLKCRLFNDVRNKKKRLDYPIPLQRPNSRSENNDTLWLYFAYSCKNQIWNFEIKWKSSFLWYTFWNLHINGFFCNRYGRSV